MDDSVFPSFKVRIACSDAIPTCGVTGSCNDELLAMDTFSGRGQILPLPSNKDVDEEVKCHAQKWNFTVLLYYVGKRSAGKANCSAKCCFPLETT